MRRFYGPNVDLDTFTESDKIPSRTSQNVPDLAKTVWNSFSHIFWCASRTFTVESTIYQTSKHQKDGRLKKKGSRRRTSSGPKSGTLVDRAHSNLRGLGRCNSQHVLSDPAVITVLVVGRRVEVISPAVVTATDMENPTGWTGYRMKTFAHQVFVKANICLFFVFILKKQTFIDILLPSNSDSYQQVLQVEKS